MFPQFTLRIVGASALALPLALTLYFRELPSAMGLILVAPISLAGAVVGVVAASCLARGWQRLMRSS